MVSFLAFIVAACVIRGFWVRGQRLEGWLFVIQPTFVICWAHRGLAFSVIAQQRETARRHDNKVIARRDEVRLRAATFGNREARKPNFFEKNSEKY
jgi:hypothetical protein